MRTKGTLSTVLSPCSDLLRASGRRMVLTIRKIMLKGSPRMTMLCEKCSHVPRFNQEVIIIGAKSTQAEELAVRYSTLAEVWMKRREMEVVGSICFLVEDRAKNLVITTPRTSRFYLLLKIHKPTTPVGR